MSAESGAESRHTNLNNSVNDSDGRISEAGESRDIPTPAERVAEFYEEYPERAQLPLAGSDGVRLRREFVEEEYEGWASASEQPFETVVKGEQRTAIEAVTWGEAVERALTRYEETRQTTVNLERGRPSDLDYAEHSVQAQTRWFADYQKSYFAQLKAWMRELTGGERPSGGSTEGIYENPHIALITRSASSVPKGERLPPVEHARAIQESWEPVYHTLRNTVRSLGFESGEWQYERRAEAHTGERGGGVNHCFGHEHTVMVVDGEVEESDLAPVVEKHVEECGPAGPDAHEVGEAIEVFRPEEVEDVAAYVASYTGIKPSGLLERETEYVAWAAAMDAGNIRTKSRSDAARHAASADRCKQRFESDQADQERGHGERVVRAVPTARHEYECAECGSPHEIAQDTTLTAHRTESEQTAVADGGRDFEAERRNSLRGRWEDARAAASVGETPTRLERREKIEAEVLRRPSASAAEVLGRLGLPASCEELVEEVRAGVDRSEVVGFERVPSWQVKSVTVGEEEYPASAGNGVEMVATDGGETWRPPHDGGRACRSCGSDSVVSAREAVSVYHEEVEGAYWCSTCGTEFGPIDAPEKPPALREESSDRSDDAGGNSVEDTVDMDTQYCPNCGTALESVLHSTYDGVDELESDGVAFKGEMRTEFDEMEVWVLECPECSYEHNEHEHAVQYQLKEIDGERSELKKDPAAA